MSTIDHKFPIISFFVWRLSILIYQIFLQPFFLITPRTASLTDRVFFVWADSWDAGHYLSIAQHGYVYPQQAFFPLWPLIIKLGQLPFLSIQMTTFFLILILGLSTFVLFYHLAVKLVGGKDAKLALLLFACFPSSMFLMAAYTEGLFLTLVLFSFILYENKKYGWSALSGIFLTATRLAGLGFTLSFIFIKSSLKKKLFLTFVSVLGIFFFSFYLWRNFNDPLLFGKAQLAWCQVSNRCGAAFPLIPLIKSAQETILNRELFTLSYPLLDWLLPLFFLIVSFIALKFLSLNYFFYSLFIIITPLISGSTASMSRYILVAFPVFFILPKILRFKVLFFLLCIILLALQFKFINLFTNNLWIA